jgi:hypothetical protein
MSFSPKAEKRRAGEGVFRRQSNPQKTRPNTLKHALQFLCEKAPKRTARNGDMGPHSSFRAFLVAMLGDGGCAFLRQFQWDWNPEKTKISR